MQKRLQLCLTCLTEVEEKLVKLQSSTQVGTDEQARITECLGFIHKAVEAISETQHRVERLRAKRMSASR